MPDMMTRPEMAQQIEGEDDSRGSEEDPMRLTVPPAVIGFLLLAAVLLACVFYIAAQVVQTP